jgi:hypothetical protein
MNKIIYLIDQPLDERNFERFGIQTWISRGWAIEVWDLTALAYPRAWLNFDESGHRLAAFVGYFPITSKAELERRYSNLEKVKYFIDLAGNSYVTLKARIRLAGRGVMRIICATGSIPAPVDSCEAGFARRLRKVFLERPIKSLLVRLINACVIRLAASLIRPGLIVASGEKSLSLADHSQAIISAHNFDYDIYLKLRESCGSASERYAVFLDQNICFHPEYVYLNIPFYATPERYFRTICNGLRTIADTLGTPMRIAAHPRLSRQKRYIDYFEGIPVEYGKTAELIANCAFVVCHFTTAVQFAVLFRKPVIFVTTDELFSSAAEKYIEKFAASLGKAVINLDGGLEEVDWPNEIQIDCSKYDEYRNQYIKGAGSPDIPHWDIVIDYLEETCGGPVAEILNPETHCGTAG